MEKLKMLKQVGTFCGNLIESNTTKHKNEILGILHEKMC